MRDPLLVEREKTHGDFKNVADISQSIKYLLEEHDTDLCTVQREALDMIGVKIARILAGDPNHEEHWLDIAGYARLGLEACSRPCGREQEQLPEAVLTDKES